MILLLKGRLVEPQMLANAPSRGTGGITPGAGFLDSGGDEWYVKAPGTKEAVEEHLRNRVYRSARQLAPLTHLVSVGQLRPSLERSEHLLAGKLRNEGDHHMVMGSKILPRFNTLWQKPWTRQSAADFLVGAGVDAALGTTDFHGANVGTVETAHGTRAARIDNGTANPYWAPKHWHPGSAHRDAAETLEQSEESITHPEVLSHGLRRLDDVVRRHGSWHLFALRNAPGAPAEHVQAFADDLTKRHDQLRQLVGSRVNPAKSPLMRHLTRERYTT